LSELRRIQELRTRKVAKTKVIVVLIFGAARTNFMPKFKEMSVSLLGTRG
jgi:hypothetical protein